jgi:hypothetical protein
MITREKLRESIARIRLMKHFPNADQDLLGALATELNELCGDDATVEELVKSLVHRVESWPGIYELRSIATSQRFQRDGVEKLRKAQAARDLHEASCCGHKIAIDETNRTVEIQPCQMEWEGFGLCYDQKLLSCRRGPSSAEVKRIIEVVLATRGPGWISRREFEERELNNKYAAKALAR